MSNRSPQLALAALAFALIVSGSAWLFSSAPASRVEVGVAPVEPTLLAAEPSTVAPEESAAESERETACETHANATSPAKSEDFVAGELPWPVTDVLELRPDLRYLRGSVLDRAGSPIARAEVFLHTTGTYSADNGSFELALAPLFIESLPADARLFARRDKHEPALVESFGARVRSATGDLREVLVLGDPLSIRGRIVDADGRPARRGRARIVDPTPFANGMNETIEVTTASFDTAAGFELGGLFDREYVLELQLYEPLMSFQTAPVRPGERDFVFSAPPEALASVVYGRVVTPDGAPLAYAELDVALSLKPGVLWPRRSNQANGVAPTKTAVNGGFALRNVPREGAWLVVEHPSLTPQSFEIAKLDLERDVELVVRRTARFTLQGFDPEVARVALELRDESGAVASWEPREPNYGDGLPGGISLSAGSAGPYSTHEGRYTVRVRAMSSAQSPRQPFAAEAQIVLVERVFDFVAGEVTAVGP